MTPLSITDIPNFPQRLCCIRVLPVLVALINIVAPPCGSMRGPNMWSDPSLRGHKA